MATVHLVDASPYIFRAHFSLPSSIKTPDGSPAAASYGFTSFLLKLIADEKPTHLAVAFDRSLNSSFRNEIYPAYKEQRVLPPPELEAQLDACEEIAAAVGAATFIDDRYEADDLIGALCRDLEEAGHGAVIVTSDKDLAQLVTERTVLFDFAKETRLDRQGVFEKFGVRPDQITDFLGLAGDTVDNIPGIKGIGGKSAAELLARFRHLEELYARLDEIPWLPVRGAKSCTPSWRPGGRSPSSPSGSPPWPGRSPACAARWRTWNSAAPTRTGSNRSSPAWGSTGSGSG